MILPLLYRGNPAVSPASFRFGESPTLHSVFTSTTASVERTKSGMDTSPQAAPENTSLKS
jgi:hypothetical protein